MASEHGYYSSQIFSGTYHEQNGKDMLADVSWGSGIGSVVFFIIGGVIVLGAGSVLIARKRSQPVRKGSANVK